MTWSWRHTLHVVSVLFALFGLVCVNAGARAYSATFDESNHLAAGLEWWQFGSYRLWTENPPLPRLAVAALPYAAGMRLPARAEWQPETHDWDRSWQVGSELLYAGAGFEENLARARLGTLPFFMLVIACVWGLADGRRRPMAGALAVALTSTLPVLLAHAALATTDVAFAAMFLLSTLCLWRWFEAPTRGRALLLGAALGLSLLCKFSTLAFFPVTVLAFLLARRLARTSMRPRFADRPLPVRALFRQLALSTLAGFLVTWAGYRFSVGPIGALTAGYKNWLQILPPQSARRGLVGALLRVPLPMPELFHGLRFLALHNRSGHAAYLLGKTSEHGFFGFYPLALLVKTPLPFLFGALLAAPLLAKQGRASWPARALVLASLGILLVSLGSHVNLGIRHVLVLLPLLAAAMATAYDAALASTRGPARAALALTVAVLVTAQANIASAARFEELGYFNALAGKEPAHILLGSDLDWGQDLFALREELRERGVEELNIAFFGTARLCRHGLPHLTALVPGKKTAGWVAISENYYRGRGGLMLLKDPCDPSSAYRASDVGPQSFAWLRDYTPVSIVGSSVRLYHIEASN